MPRLPPPPSSPRPLPLRPPSVSPWALRQPIPVHLGCCCSAARAERLRLCWPWSSGPTTERPRKRAVLAGLHLSKNLHTHVW
eukprot:scaffold38318_cov61-Phaeocystis_antarctica.AAC.4